MGDTVWLFSLVLAHSRWLWGRFCTSQNFQTALRCHIAAFEAIGTDCTNMPDDSAARVTRDPNRVRASRGHHLEHNFGHGKDTLASVLVVLNLLAFALHAACDLTETQWQQARQRLGARIRVFEHPRTITAYQVFRSWNALMNLLATGGTAQQPP